ncbi:hypothetical protein CBL_03599 [Carabus blaptoides fortunei]
MNSYHPTFAKPCELLIYGEIIVKRATVQLVDRAPRCRRPVRPEAATSFLYCIILSTARGYSSSDKIYNQGRACKSAGDMKYGPSAYSYKQPDNHNSLMFKYAD